MWDAIDKAPPRLLTLHLKLTNRLAGLAWNRVQIWDSRTSVHSWTFIDGVVLAFDTVPTPEKTTLTLVVRQKSWVDRVRAAMTSSALPTPALNSQRPERMHLGTFDGTDAADLDSLADEIAVSIRKTRTAIEDLLRPSETWTDPASGLKFRYTVKPERKECKEVIFLFTSIRTNHDWLDFKGPYGPAVQPNRARIVYLEDIFTEEFSYHLAIGGDTSVRQATAEFIKHYVSAHGYSWEQVTLAGMSKGGTAAIVVGALLPNCTVVALAPQLCVGNYLYGSRKDILGNITGMAPDEAARERVDELMWSGIPENMGNHGISTCYVLTSAGDPDCTNGLPRFVARFDSPERVVVSVDRSGGAPTHFKTVHFLSPLFLSMLGIISAGLRPAGWLGTSSNFDDLVQ
jgi:hypothetical protein